MKHPLNFLLRFGRSAAEHASLVGDLSETYQREIRPSHSWIAAQLWYLGQIASAVAFASRDGLGAPRPSFAWMWRDVGRDALYAARLIRRQPGVLAAALLGLGVTIGISTAIFSAMNALVFRPVGVEKPESLVRIMRSYTGGVSTGVPFAEYRHLRDNARSVALEAMTFAPAPIETDTGHVQMSFVSGSLFLTMGARTQLGRILTPADDQASAPSVAVVSDWYWRKRLGRDPGVIGRTIAANGERITIVGVSAPEYRGPTANPPPYWTTLSVYPRVFVGSQLLTSGTSDGVNVWGMLAPGASTETARAELSALSAGIAPTLADLNGVTRNGVRVDAAGSPVSGAEGPVVLILVTLVTVAIGLILLLACLNLANLLFASATTRQREIGVRLAIGATRGRLIRQLLTESIMLGVVGGAAAWLFTVWGLPWLAVAAGVPANVDLTPDVRVYVFLVGATMIAGAGTGLLPALHGTRGDLVSPLKDAAGSGPARQPRRVRTTLVGLQACACLVLLIAATLLTRSLSRATTLDFGFDMNRLLVITPSLETQGYDAPRAAAFFDRTRTDLGALPGVEAVSLVLNPPLGNRRWTNMVRTGGRVIEAHHNRVDPKYFSAMGWRVVRGQDFRAAPDDANQVIVTASVAAALPSGLDPIGQPLSRIDPALGSRPIIGVVSNARTTDVRDRDGWQIIEPLTRRDQLEVSILVRVNGSPGALVPSVRAAMSAIDPVVHPSLVVVADALHGQLEDMRFLAAVSTTLGGLALCLAVTGLYGITTFVVSQRRREIGVRIAIGATPQRVVRLLVVDLMRPILFGLAAGVVLAVVVGWGLAGALVGISGHDGLSFVMGALILSIAAAGAILWPARRVLRIQPTEALRAE